MGKYGVLDELKEIGISFPELSEEDKRINTINRFGYTIHMTQLTDGRWSVWIFKVHDLEVEHCEQTAYHANRLDALKEAACLVINR